jgi:hypothetical protein
MMKSRAVAESEMVTVFEVLLHPPALAAFTE